MSLEKETADGAESGMPGETDEPATETAATGAADRDAEAPAERCCSRRAVLGAAAGTAAMVSPVSGSVGSIEAGATLQVNVYPGPTPVYGRLRDGVGGLASDWTDAHAAAAAAVADALEQVETYAAETGREWIDVAVERGDAIGGPLAASSPLDALAPASRVYDRFREAIAAADGRDDACCHLLLWWGPFDFEIGYGRTLPGEAPVGVGDRAATLAVANVGASEGWDGRAVTQNMAVHEALHPFLTSSDAEAACGSGCEHDLGGVFEPEPGRLEASPMATAYTGGTATESALDHLVAGFTGRTPGGTRWNGRGCVDRDAVLGDRSVADGTTWRHATDLTAETKEAVCRYAERTLG